MYFDLFFLLILGNIILSNGAKWTLTGVMLPDEGKKRVSKPKLSKRMRYKEDLTRVVIAYEIYETSYQLVS